MSADQLRRKLRKRHSRARRNVLSSIFIGLVLCLFFASGCVTTRELIPRLGFGVLAVWSAYFAYQAYKWIWPGRLAPDTSFSTTLQSYRSELEKRRDYVRHIWRRAGLTFCFLGLALVLFPLLMSSFRHPGVLLNALPVVVLLAIWCAIFFPHRKRNQRKLQREIDGLRVLETDNRS